MTRLFFEVNGHKFVTLDEAVKYRKETFNNLTVDNEPKAVFESIRDYQFNGFKVN